MTYTELMVWFLQNIEKLEESVFVKLPDGTHGYLRVNVDGLLEIFNGR